MNLRLPKLLESARRESCVNCLAEDGTVVWAHSNALADGHGSHFKAHDLMGCYACVRCHDLIDGRSGAMTKQQKRSLFLEMWAASMVRLIERGYFDALARVAVPA